MSDMRSLALTRAYELVEAGKSDEARTVLEPILLNDRDNVDAWWIYAHAVEDPTEARRALDNVIRLDRDYPGATDLLATLTEQYPETEAEAEPIPAVVSVPADEEPEPEFADDESYVEETRYTPVPAPARTSGSPSWLPIAAVLALVALLFIALLLILPGLNQTPPPTPTSVAAFTTSEPTAVVVVPPTEEATDAVTMPEVTEVVLLNVTPIGEDAGDEATEAVEPDEEEPTQSADVPAETEMADVQPDETDAGGEMPTEVAVVGLVVTETAAQEDQTLTGEEAPATESLLLPATEESEILAPTEAGEEPEATDEPVAELAEVDYTERLTTALQSFAVAAQPIEELETEFGETVVARVCTSEGLELRETLRSVMDIVANEAEGLPENLTGVGVRLINCDMDRTLRIIAVERETASSYAEDQLDDTSFEASWRAQ